MKPLLILVALLFCPLAAAAGDLEIKDAFIPAPPPAARMAAAYLTVNNGEEEAVVIVGAECQRPVRCELHRSVIEDGMASMDEAGPIPVAAGASERFEPGGLHMMIHGASLAKGDTLAFHLLLKDGRRVPAEARVIGVGEPASGAAD